MSSAPLKSKTQWLPCWPLSLQCCWYKVQRGTIACRKRNTALSAIFISYYLRPIVPNAQCSVHQIESPTMLTLEIRQVLEPYPGYRGQLWQNWAQTIRASSVKQWQRWFLKLSVSQKPKFQYHFLLLVELNYRTRLDSGFPVSPKQQEVRLGRGRMLIKTLKLRCMQACKCFIVCLFVCFEIRSRGRA